MKPVPPPPPPEPTAPGRKGYDPLLDPLPLPEVHESDSETAWGRWEELVASDVPGSEPEPAHPTFEDTVPAGLLDLPPLRKP